MRVVSLAAAAALGASVLLTTVAAPAGADAMGGGKHKVTGWAHLDGEQEVPGPGDGNGEGRFRYKIENGTFCYKLSVRRVATPTAAHIHFGPRGEAGPIAVTLKTPPRNGAVSDCIRARSWQNPNNAARVLTFWELEGIKKDPFFFYVNVHNDRFPAGAVRGQLMKSHR
ncbi:CHRD domain-containing protein [Streptomyces sp. RKND-216]|uniref:CHRD domain-containing protein n=1 Tax=Streptomyces sp. RKND-216 TaxID=2562581 RepID=UPI00109E29EA|nr:CHRD domain-containing protein [Streptomyces sp. RKND-216]THA23713.1 CHRD domain-containing protein [Streptomyces sp. RKND-216]